jgi:hypothetical protein
VRRRGHNIFEVSDEPWQRDGVLLADTIAHELRTDVFGPAEPQLEGRKDAESLDKALEAQACFSPPRDAPAFVGPGKLLVASGALVAGAIAIASIALSDRGSEPSPRARAGPAPVKSAPTIARRAGRGEYQSNPHRQSSRPANATREAPATGAPINGRNARQAGASQILPSQTRPPAESKAPGQEFSFER